MDLVNYAEVPLLCLQVSYPDPRQPAHAAGVSRADGDDNVPILCFTHRSALVSCYSDDGALDLYPLPPPSSVFDRMHMHIRQYASATHDGTALVAQRYD